MIVYPKQHKIDMDKIARLRQEIERRLNILTNVYAEQVERKDEEMMNYYHGKVIALEELRPFLDTLSEEPDKSLEEAAENIYKVPFGTRAEDFIAGAEWQKQQDLAEMAQSKSPLSVAYANRCFENGKQAMKQQMLKDAVEGEVIKTDKHTSVRYKSFYGTDRYFYGIADKQFKPGDKVRIVVLKEEEEK